MKNKLTKNRIKTVKSFVNGVGWLFCISIICYLLTTVLRALLPKVIAFCTDYILGAKEFVSTNSSVLQTVQNLINNPLQALWWCAGAVIVISVLAGVVTIFARMSLAKGSETMLKKIRDRLYGHIQRLPFDWHVKNSAGDIIQRCTSDVEVVRNFICLQLLEVFRILFTVAISIAMMLYINPTLSIVAIVFIPVVIGYSVVFYGRISSKFLIADEAEAELSTCVQENLNGVRVVRAFGREKFEMDKFNEKNETFAKMWIKLGYLLSKFWAIGDLITGLQIMVVVVSGTYLIIDGSMTIGDFMAFVIYNSTLIWPIRSLGRILSEMSKAGVSIDRLTYILDEPIESDTKGSEEIQMSQDIVFDIKEFAYDANTPVLKNIKFTVEKGKTFAILGGTGSGKSTLMYLLDRLYDIPTECGKITIGGVDIKNIPLKYLRENIGVVLQEPFLFSRSIVDNIKISLPDSSMEDIRKATQIACVDDAITEFSNGYETIVGEKGVTLSGGQKQRVAISRMLLQKTPIKIFDDSLSAVDSNTDLQIRTALQEQMGESTVILISHRISTLMHSDNILVLENGEMAQLGTHKELVGQDGIYKSIYDIQIGNAQKETAEKEAEINGKQNRI